MRLKGGQSISPRFEKQPGGRRMKICFSCKKELDIEGKPGRGDECSCCGADVLVCLNCRFLSPGAHNDCSEPMAERVLVKDRANYCEYFEFGVRDGAEQEKDPLKGLKDLAS